MECQRVDQDGHLKNLKESYLATTWLWISRGGVDVEEIRCREKLEDVQVWEAGSNQSKRELSDQGQGDGRKRFVQEVPGARMKDKLRCRDCDEC